VDDGAPAASIPSWSVSGEATGSGWDILTSGDCTS
jgi:hypothetical protein